MDVTEIYESPCKHSFRFVCVVLLTFSLFMVSCSGNGGAGVADSDSTVTDSVASEEYFAENDIAMVVRSMVDAINVGERLDTAEYNFEGVLTDGQGSPLYTDVQGSPGQWEVTVYGDSARIRNLYLGDLLPQYLKGYITNTLELTEENKIMDEGAGMETGTDFEAYTFGNGHIMFETRSVATSGGDEGPLMLITLATENRQAKSKQKNKS